MTELTAVAAGLLYLVAVVLLLAVRTWQQYRSTGSTGFNGFRGAAQDPAARVAGIGFAMAVLTGLVAPWLAAVGVVPVWGLPIAVTAVGAVVAAGGLLLGMTAQRAMGRSWRIGVDVAESTDLVTHGPFRLVRNPIFTALMMIQVGTAIMALSWLSLVGAVLMIAACQLQTRWVEEPYLRRRHPTTYPDYAATAGRFVPGLGRLHPTSLSPHAAGDPA
jgi:protein-S-isoprenylcysteine O-methyltransferase Ste14